MATFFATQHCALGIVLVAQTEQGIGAILLGDDVTALVAELQQCFSPAELMENQAMLSQALAQVIQLIEQPHTPLPLPLDIQGSEFQRRVWSALQQIPAGEIRSYSQLAAMIGAPSAARAVASACATNKLAIAIPCHRVVRSNGDLSGYRWGVERKKQLLKRELELKQH